MEQTKFKISTALFFLFILIVSCNTMKKKTQEKPNVVVIFSDEYDFSYVGAFGGDVMTPAMDKLAAEGVRFTEAYCVSSVCNPSRFTALTGLYPSSCKTEFIKNYSLEPGPLNVGFVFGVNRQTPTIARILSSSGYYTGFVGKWGIQGDPDLVENLRMYSIPPNVDPDTPEGDTKLKQWQEGFSDWVKQSAGFDYAASLYDNVNNRYPEKIRHHHIEWITQGAVDFIEEAKEKGQPFYLHVCPTTVHGPGHSQELNADVSYTPGGHFQKHVNVQPPRSEIAQRLQNAGLPVNDETVGMLQLDDQVNAIVNKLEEEGLMDNTLFLVLPDHNVEPGKATCFQKGLHVPVIACWEGRLEPGKIFGERVSYVDLVPTILDATGTKTENNFDGLSFWEALTENKPLDRDFLYFEMYTSRAILQGDYKYITYRHQPSMIEEMNEGETEVALDYTGGKSNLHSRIAIRYFPHYFDLDQLYNIEEDIWEQKNLADNEDQKERLAAMKQTLEDFTQQFDKPFDMSIDPFYETEKYQELVKNRIEGDKNKSWWRNGYEHRDKVYLLNGKFEGIQR